MEYPITQELSLPGLADPRHTELTLKEYKSKHEARVIGGDKGDLHFKGYTLDEDNDKTILYKPVLVTSIEGLTEDEAFDIASEVLMFSYESIGLETVEHS